MKNEKSSLKKCPNCKTYLPSSAKYCFSCGQKYLPKPIRDLWPFLVGGFQDIFNINSLLFTTPLKLFKPAELTLAFARGERKKYASPIRLFLMMGLVFLFTLNYQLKRDGIYDNIVKGHEGAVIELSKKSIINDMRKQVVQFDKDSSLAHEVLDSMETLLDTNAFSNNTFNFFETDIYQEELFLLEKDSIISKYQIDTLDFIGQIVVDKLIDSQKDGKGMVSHIIGSTIWLLLAMLPFFAFIMKLLYIRGKRYYLEHFVFGLHIHTFYLFLATVLLMLLYWLEYYIDHYLDEWIVFNFIFLIATIYTYFALKLYYKQSYGKTFFKLLMLGFFYLFVASIITVFGLLISAALF